MDSSCKLNQIEFQGPFRQRCFRIREQLPFPGQPRHGFKRNQVQFKLSGTPRHEFTFPGSPPPWIYLETHITLEFLVQEQSVTHLLNI